MYLTIKQQVKHLTKEEYNILTIPFSNAFKKNMKLKFKLKFLKY